VLGYVLLHGGADHIDLEIMVSCKAESGFREVGREAHVLHLFRDFSVLERQDVRG